MENLFRTRQNNSNKVTSRLNSTAKESISNSSMENFFQDVDLKGRNKTFNQTESTQKQNLSSLYNQQIYVPGMINQSFRTRI